MDDENIQHYTVRVHFPNGESEVFNNATEPDEDGDRVQFTDKNGKQQIFKGVPFHITEE